MLTCQFGSRLMVAAFGLVFLFARSIGAEYIAFDDVHEMPLGRSDMTVSPIRVGEEMRMYVVGGCISDQICYDPDSTMECYCGGLTNQTHYYRPSDNSYEVAAAMPRERYRHAAAQVGGVIYLFGGRTLADEVILEVDAYDTATDSWRTPCSWAAAGSDNTAFTDGTSIWLVGGWTADYSEAISQLLEFNPETCGFTKREPLPTPRGDVSSVTVDGRHFVMGGFTSGDFCNGSKVIESYHAESDTWTSHEDLAIGRGDMAVGKIEGHVFAIAGETVNNKCSRAVPVRDVERLDSGESATAGSYDGGWTIEQEVPSDRFRFVGASFGRSIFLFGGQGSWVDNLDGQGNGGFPIHRTTMLYTPKEYGTLNDDTTDAAAKTSAIVRAASVIAAAVAAVVF